MYITETAEASSQSSTVISAAPGPNNVVVAAAGDKGADEAKTELEALQAKAVFSLVETIFVNNLEKKLLFLTNNQVSSCVRTSRNVLCLHLSASFLLTYEAPGRALDSLYTSVDIHVQAFQPYAGVIICCLRPR
jgi:hypothetical protein